MPKQVSIAEARDNLTAIVRGVERGQPVELTRRGKPVAVLISKLEYKKLASGTRDLWDSIQTFRETHDLTDLRVDEIYADVRDPSPGREVDL
jgi:prevent-host-death family protein